jgi:hypothetical protein
MDFAKRPYAGFMCYSHQDQAAADKIYRWLTVYCGLNIFRDHESINTGDMFSSVLAAKIRESRSCIFLLSKSAMASPYVEEELGRIINQRVKFAAFRIIPVLIDDSEIPFGFIANRDILVVPNGDLTGKTATKLLLAINNLEVNTGVRIEGIKDIYLSTSWREDERFSLMLTQLLVKNSEYRYIGDSKDQTAAREDRIEAIIKSCSGLLAIMPNRDNGRTSKYIINEIEIAEKNGVPCILVAEKKGFCFPLHRSIYFMQLVLRTRRLTLQYRAF